VRMFRIETMNRKIDGVALTTAGSYIMVNSTNEGKTIPLHPGAG
jgi:hypothetical protein